MGMRLGDLLPKKIAKHGLTRPVLAAQVVSAWAEIIDQLLPKVGKSCQAISLSKTNVLAIRCKHATVASELASRQDDILKHYLKLFPKLKLSIRFRTGELVSREIDKL